MDVIGSLSLVCLVMACLLVLKSRWDTRQEQQACIFQQQYADLLERLNARKD